MVKYVFPDCGGLTRRGGLVERWQFASLTGCSMVEVPGGLIADRNESLRTETKVGSFLSPRDVVTLYHGHEVLSSEVDYILCTERSLPVTGSTATGPIELKWYLSSWIDQYIKQIITIVEWFERQPSFMEVSLGRTPNSPKDLIKGITTLRDEFKDAYGSSPKFLIRNARSHLLSRGSDLLEFWHLVGTEDASLRSDIGFMVDLWELSRATGANFIKELGVVPTRAVKGIRVHRAGQVPSLTDQVQWLEAIGIFVKADKDIMLVPDVVHKNKVQPCIGFCDMMLEALD